MLGVEVMTAKPTDYPEMPPVAETPEQLLREGLRCLQLSGAIFLRAHFTAPWSYESPDSEGIVAALRPGGRRVILFHIFVEGRCQLELERGGHEELAAGDIAIFPFADQHRVGDPGLEGAVPIFQLMPPMPWTTLPVVRHGGGGAATSMVCGYLLCDDLPFNPVLASLPPFIRVRPSGGPLARWVEASVQYALDASGSRNAVGDPLLQRLPELMFLECLCEFARTQPASEVGWLAALGDPIVGRALACLHRQPEQPWSLKELARRAATSRSVLDDRFRQLLGLAPMSYLAAWRLQLAGRQLRTTNASLAEIAAAVGYGSEASFSRAFKRHVGESPGTWRRAA
jgi:AraC family transcriptional regulator, alkane utilization regulator